MWLKRKIKCLSNKLLLKLIKAKFMIFKYQGNSNNASINVLEFLNVCFALDPSEPLSASRFIARIHWSFSNKKKKLKDHSIL